VVDAAAGPVRSMRQWTSLASFLLVLLLAGAADGLMESLGPEGFLAAGLATLALAWALLNFNGKEPSKWSIRN